VVEYAEDGFTALKLDPVPALMGLTDHAGQLVPVQLSLEVLSQAEEIIGTIRDAVGARCDILIGTHGQMTASSALRLAKRLEEYEPLWLEEPVPPEMPEEMAKVARGTTIPITAGERLTSKWEFARLIHSGAVAICNLDVSQVGGLLEAKKIAALAESHYVQISPHVYGGPLVAAASIQLSTCCANFLIMEGIETYAGIHRELLDPPIEWQQGYFVPSTRPGLGHVLNEELARELTAV
jgi:L-alanine-DL-glutamate epimerase-like enolase superfamily enzyme